MVATIFQNGHKNAKASLPHQQTAQTHRQQVKEMLPNRVVGYSPDLARIVGGATTGLFLSQLLFLSDKGANPEGWVYKSEQEMGKETGLTKREQQTARRKLLALGVIAIMRGGWKNTYHFKVMWQRLYQVIEQSLNSQTVANQWQQNAATEKSERTQTVPTDREQTVSTELVECQQTVSTQWRQNVPTHNRENNTENKEAEKTDRENGLLWQKTIEKIQEDLPLGESAAQLTGTSLLQVTDTAACIGVANPFHIAWLERRLYGQICKALKRVVGKDLDLQFVTSCGSFPPAGSFGV
jgi:hypothetical protein